MDGPGVKPFSLQELPARLRRRLTRERAERQLEREFAALMDTALPAYAIRANAGRGPKVAIATFSSGSWHFVLEALLAHALALRGASPELLMCDLPALPVCDERTSLLRDPRRCPGCVAAKRPLLDACRIPWRGMSAFVDDGAMERAERVVAALRDEDLEHFSYGPWPIGRWTFVSVCHFLRSDARGSEAETIAVRRLFLASAIVVVEAVERWLGEIQPDILIAESGAHFMWRIACELARARNIRVVCREIGKGGFDTHIYSLNAECMFPNWTDIWAQAKTVPLTTPEAERVDACLRSLPARTYAPPGEETPTEDRDRLQRDLRLDRHGRVVVAFTGVTWDLATAGRDVGFDGMFDWLSETLRLAERHPDVQFVIRAHPAERHVLTRERALDVIERQWPSLPSNVRTIAPERSMSVRGLCDIADLVLTYCSTTGIEAAIYERPVLLCGAPHYRGKGFTIDIQSRADYRETFERWSRGSVGLPPDAPETARRYFHLFFMRYHIEMGWTTSPLEPPFSLTIRDLSELLPGRSRAVDVVCSGVLEGREILLPAAGA